jgi:hypothetical protein
MWKIAILLTKNDFIDQKSVLALTRIAKKPSWKRGKIAI